MRIGIVHGTELKKAFRKALAYEMDRSFLVGDGSGKSGKLGSTPQPCID